MDAAVAQPKPQGQSLINVMAAKYNMEPKAYADAVKKTAMPSNATTEEFAAFMMVAREYNLNPLLKEIHAFPKKGGGIVPVVSIDGWVSLINQNPMLDGFEFEMHYSDKAELVACTCRIYRKDRRFPTVVTEYLSECYRATDPWKMKHRMLRHKALIQAARYCFGFSGIMDDDEAAKIAEMRDITPPSPTRPQLSQFVNPKQQPPVNGDEHQTQPEQPDNPMPEFSAADAHEMGREHRRQDKALKASPGEWRDGTPEHNAWIEAREDGWREEDKEITERERAAKKADVRAGAET
jgi:phage recombination protein Bet